MNPNNHHVGLLVSTVFRMINEDPLFFGVQVSRKLPSEIRARLGNLGEKIPETSIGEFLQFLADKPVNITHSNVLADELLALKGQDPGLNSRSQARARYTWNIGHVSEAIAMLPKSSNLRRRFEGEKKILSGAPLSLKQPNQQPNRDSSNFDVLHVLVNSAPHTSSGYTVRTRAILRGQREQGLKVAGVTRIGYPITIGKFFPSSVDVVDSIPYFRLLPNSLPASPFDRLSKHAQMLAHIVEELKPRCLHATTNYTNGVVAEAVAQTYNIPWVYEMRGQLEKTWVARHPTEHQAAAAASEKYRLMLTRETALAKSANAVVVLSHIQKKDLIARGIDAEKIHVIPNAYTPDKKVPKRTPREARKLLDLPEAFTIGTITSVVDYEGLDTLVRAIDILRGRGHAVQGVIAGDGVSRPHIQSLITQLGRDKHMTTPGRVSHEDSHAWYQALDVFAIPRKKTLVTETITPIKPIEAMSNATPVVASDLPPLRELIVDSGAGLAFEPENPVAMANTIETLITDQSTYHAASRAALANAQAHTWEVNLQRYAHLYESL